jgi:hypothetical protein
VATKKDFLFLTLTGIFFFSQVSAQTIIRGKIMDSLSRQPVAFANLTLEDDKSGTTTEIEGNFSLTVPRDYKGLIYITHVSYNKLTVALSYLQNHSTIFLIPGATQLNEVVILSTETENPAFRIIRQAVAHKK